MSYRLWFLLLCICILPACVRQAQNSVGSVPTVAEAELFIKNAEEQLQALYIDAERTGWLKANFVTHDTNIIAAQAGERLTSTMVALSKEAKRFSGLPLSDDLQRKLKKIKLKINLPAPADKRKSNELAQINALMGSLYAKGKYCPVDGDCLELGDLSRIIAKSRNPAELEEAWVGWHKIAPAMKPYYQRMVDISNEGASELGYADVGAMWRSKYDMPADNFALELDRLWAQVKPLYDDLHCHVRVRLAEQYGSRLVKMDEPIPAHLLGNMWAQSWSNIYPLVGPEQSDPGYDVSELLIANGYDAIKMVKTAEAFFSSLGFAPLPDSFWQRSLFIKPRDRAVQCHASAWNVDFDNDLRIKMCININEEDFETIHHELGHNYYQRAYRNLSILYKDSANDGFHEAIGDTVALSVTPAYLKQLGLIDKEPGVETDIGLLMKLALDKISFLPFALVMDQWRWKVFKGEVSADNYNRSWWQLREKYQGIKAPVTRTEEDFDPGAKYHIPGNVSYTRYFLARILQFQFHKALCAISGYEGPLHRCSVYGNRDAGAALQGVLALGGSRPWQDALYKITRSREMDAEAILDYFAPLKTWLEQQNKERQCGW